MKNKPIESQEEPHVVVYPSQHMDWLKLAQNKTLEAKTAMERFNFELAYHNIETVIEILNRVEKELS